MDVSRSPAVRLHAKDDSKSDSQSYSATNLP